MGILLEEESALKAGMDGTHLGLTAEQPEITLRRAAQQKRIRVWCPPGITVRMCDLGTGQTEYRLHHQHRILLGAAHGRTLRRRYHHTSLLRLLYGCKIGRRFDQTLHRLRHGQHTARHAHQRSDQLSEYKNRTHEQE